MNIAKIIDHTILKPEADEAKVKSICQEAKTHGFFSVCINPHYVPLAKKELEGSEVKVCTVIGFPLGVNTTNTKAFETLKAVKDGADEVDMVINVGALKSKDDQFVEADIKAVVEAAEGALVKVIIETCLLTDEEKVRACELAKKAGADFVKTSTGFGSAGAKAEDIALMRKTVGPDMGIKASGGIRDMETAMKMVENGATRIGAGSSLSIIGKS